MNKKKTARKAAKPGGVPRRKSRGVEPGRAPRRVRGATAALAEARFQALIRLSSDFYWETDADHRLTMLVLGAAHRGALPRERLIGRPRWEMHSVSPDPAAWQAHTAALEARSRGGSRSRVLGISPPGSRVRVGPADSRRAAWSGIVDSTRRRENGQHRGASRPGHRGDR